MERIFLSTLRALVLGFLLSALGLPFFAMAGGNNRSAARTPTKKTKAPPKMRFMDSNEFQKEYQALERAGAASKARIDKLVKRGEEISDELDKKYPALSHQYKKTKKLTPQMAKIMVDHGVVQVMDLMRLEGSKALAIMTKFKNRHYNTYVRNPHTHQIVHMKTFFDSAEWKKSENEIQKFFKLIDSERKKILSIARLHGIKPRRR